MSEIRSLRRLSAAAAALESEWAGALVVPPAERVDDDVQAMSGDGLVRAIEALGALGRQVEAVQARCAAELAARSRGGSSDGAADSALLGDDDLARRHGYASAERLLASSTGRGYRDAARLVSVGEATARRSSFSGEPLPPRHPLLAVAIDDGRLCTDAADLIRRFLDGVAPRASSDELEAAEGLLVEQAPIVGLDGLPRIMKRLGAYLDPDGVEPREESLRDRRSLRVWEDRAGMIRVQGAFDPFNGAPIKVAVDALVSAELRAARDAGGGTAGADPLFAEHRTIGQLKADALADLARHALGCDTAPTSLRKVTVVARIDADVLVSGRGHAAIDGIDQPISVASARELALSAGIAPLLVGPGCERLELGRSARLFSAAQKVVLVERDGGCAWPGCQRPAAYSEAHHIAWWDRDDGPTDVDNAVNS